MAYSHLRFISLKSLDSLNRVLTVPKFSRLDLLNISKVPSRNSFDPWTVGIRNYKCSSLLQNSKVEETTPKLVLSDSCVARLKEITKPEEKSFLRVLIEGGGCSGFQYKFLIDSTLDEEDRVFERDGVKVVLDETSLEYVKGSTIDYHVELIRSAFRIIDNPLAEAGCSCGASFSIKI